MFSELGGSLRLPTKNREKEGEKKSAATMPASGFGAAALMAGVLSSAETGAVEGGLSTWDGDSTIEGDEGIRKPSSPSSEGGIKSAPTAKRLSTERTKQMYEIHKQTQVGVERAVVTPLGGRMWSIRPSSSRP